MKYIKTFEENDEIIYSVGDIVVCVNAEDLVTIKNGEKYKVLMIYNCIDKEQYFVTKSNIGDLYLQLKNIETNHKVEDVRADRFDNEFNNDLNKYNL
jgi:hypothetical protein